MKKLVFLVYILLAFAVYPQEENKIIAKVNDEVITLGDLNHYTRLFSEGKNSPDFHKRALESMINNKLIAQTAKKDGIKVPAGFVEQRLQELIATYSSVSEFEKSLVEEGLNITILKERIKEAVIFRLGGLNKNM